MTQISFDLDRLRGAYRNATVTSTAVVAEVFRRIDAAGGDAVWISRRTPDALDVLRVAQGFDEAYAYSRPAPPQYSLGVTPIPERFHFGIPNAARREFFGDPEARTLFDRAIDGVIAIGVFNAQHRRRNLAHAIHRNWRNSVRPGATPHLRVSPRRSIGAPTCRLVRPDFACQICDRVLVGK